MKNNSIKRVKFVKIRTMEMKVISFPLQLNDANNMRVFESELLDVKHSLNQNVFCIQQITVLYFYL